MWIKKVEELKLLKLLTIIKKYFKIIKINLLKI